MSGLSVSELWSWLADFLGQPKNLISVMIALGSGAIALVGWMLARWSEQEHLLIESLKLFDGGTQKRSVGLAIIERYRGRLGRRHLSLVVPLLANQANYLIREKPPTEEHEKANLWRILIMLLWLHRKYQDKFPNAYKEFVSSLAVSQQAPLVFDAVAAYDEIVRPIEERRGTGAKTGAKLA